MDRKKLYLKKFSIGPKRKLYNELTNIDKSVASVIQEIIEEIEIYDSGILLFWQKEGLIPKLFTYLLHYVVPFYELLRYEKKEKDTSLLVVQLLSCFCWRTFDNCIDAHEGHKKAHLTSLLSCLQITEYTRSRSARFVSSDIPRHYEIMTHQSLMETESPISLQDIWKRCSIFLYAPESLAKLNEDSIWLFKNYINYSGVAHDIQDLLSDISGGVISLPVFWMREINQFGIIDVSVVKALYERAGSAVKSIEDEFNERGVEKRFPLISHLLKASYQILHDS